MADKLDVLTAEVNALYSRMLDADRERSIKQGHLLIEARRLLRQKNGVNRASPVGPDGLQAPKGWSKWLEENCPDITMRRSQRLIALAADSV
jgi:hypothetical protein